MTTAASRRLTVQRATAAVFVVLLLPLLAVFGAVADEQPIVAGQPAPRTVVAERPVRVTDEAGTANARAIAAESVEPHTRSDRDAQAAAVADTRAAFSVARSARAPVPPDSRIPLRSVQADTIMQTGLDRELAVALVDVSGTNLDVVERETIAIVQLLVRQSIAADELSDRIAEVLDLELAVRTFPGNTAETIARPLVERVMRPTIVVDPDATSAARQAAAEAVEEISRSWAAGEPIVVEGAMVDALQLRALEQLRLEGASPVRSMLRGLVAAVVLVVLGGVYLMRMQPKVWNTSKKLLLLTGLVLTFAALMTGIGALVDATGSAWSYLVPSGALAMLVALLIHPAVGIATVLPVGLLTLLFSPTTTGAFLFGVAAVLVSVPLTTRITSRSDLRSATLRAGMSYPLLAAASVALLGPRDDLWLAIGVGAINGLVTALVVQGALPFIENLFRLPTVTALLDLSDRNHPLLRELETKALGSYNHSVMVASLTERACREVGADPLLGTVAALYHDIGKVRQPHFFIENQQGIANPHDELEPEISAIIIMNHVKDGVEMAVEYRLPPEVVACIGSHHGTMKVTYFYDKAVRAAGGDASQVDEDHFRYQGTKPRSKEAAILLLADCCEATTRAMAMSRGTLPREDIEKVVAQLLQERVDDGQFDDCDLTFRELRRTRDTIVESLVGIYHPRIAYPSTTPRRSGDPDARVERPDTVNVR